MHCRLDINEVKYAFKLISSIILCYCQSILFRSDKKSVICQSWLHVSLLSLFLIMFVGCLLLCSSNKSSWKWSDTPSLTHSPLLLLYGFCWQERKKKKVTSNLSLFYCFCYFLHGTFWICLSCFFLLFSLWTSIYVLHSVSLMLSSLCALSSPQLFFSKFNSF